MSLTPTAGEAKKRVVSPGGSSSDRLERRGEGSDVGEGVEGGEEAQDGSR